MAHSCGGGSSSGGGGGGCSFHSGFSSSGSSDLHHPRRCYSYKNRQGKTRYVYSDENPGDPDPVSPALRILWIFVIVFMIQLFSGLLFFPQRVAIRHCNILIEDTMQVISNEAQLKKTMELFFQETGVMPAVVTVSEESWQQSYDDFTEFALDQYYAYFKDEFHLLVIYAVPESCRGNPNTGTSQGIWHFECIIGDRVEESINDNLSFRFSKTIYNRLIKEKSPGKVFQQAFQWMVDTRNSFVETNQGVVVIFTLLSPFTFAPYLVNLSRTFRRFKYKNAVLVKPLSKKEKQALRKKQKKQRKISGKVHG